MALGVGGEWSLARGRAAGGWEKRSSKAREKQHKGVKKTRVEPKMDTVAMIEVFMSLTGTDEAFAMSFLESANWNLEEAVNVFLGGAPTAAATSGGRAPTSASARAASAAAEDPIEQLMREHGMDRGKTLTRF